MLEKVRYFITRALRNMRQWPFLCFASILTMAVALATVATFFLVVVNVEQLAQRWTGELQIIAYLNKAPTQQQLSAQMKKLRNFTEVDNITYVSSAQALERFKKRLGQDASLLEGMNASLLPASYELKLKSEFRNQTGIDTIVEKLNHTIDVDELHYGQKWLERFNSFVGMLRYIGIVLGSFLLLAALFIVSNTIRLTLYARRDELEIMSLVGATMRFIKVPFVLEGALQGLVGGILALLFLTLSFTFIISHTLKSFWLTPTDFGLLFLTPTQQIFLVSAGIVLGVLGSLTSLRRFVRV